MTSQSGIDWDDALANMPYIADGAAYPGRWAAAAQEFRTQMAAKAAARLNLSYGAQPRERLDLFLPAGVPRGLIVFVHGGFWLRFDKSVWSHLAAGGVAQGMAVAIPSYTLAPEAGIPRITGQIARAINTAAAQVAGPIYLAGHSAGGHLVTRMICADMSLAQAVANRIEHVLSISGLHDLRPLLCTAMNRQLALTAQTASTESPALQVPLPGIPVTVWVGGHERPEFLRQSALLRESWAHRGADATLVVDGYYHHFNVIEGLAHPQSPLMAALLRQNS